MLRTTFFNLNILRFSSIRTSVLFFFFGLETPIFQVIFKKVLKRLRGSAALMTVQFIGSSTLDACQDGAT